MATFRETFLASGQYIQPKLKELGFELSEITKPVESGTQYVFGRLHFVEDPSIRKLFKKKRFITIALAPLRLELDLDIGAGQHSFGIEELYHLEMDSALPNRQHDLYQAMYDEEQLTWEFDRLIQALQECGARFFAGNSEIWKELHQRRLGFALEAQNQMAQRDSELAFKSQNWDEVIKLLEPIQSTLSKLNLARLNYAKKQLGQQ